MNRVEYLLRAVRRRLADGPRPIDATHGVTLPAICLFQLGLQVRERRPSLNRTLDLAGETLTEVARLLVDAGLDADEIVERFRTAIDRPHEPRSPYQPAVLNELTVAMEHMHDLGRAAIDFAGGSLRTNRPLIDHAVGAAGCILTAVLKTADPAAGAR